jgi:hypothetical protein
MRWLLVRWSQVSHFFDRIDFREKEFNWKASCKTIRKWWFCYPSKPYQSLVEKLFGTTSFDEKILGGNKIENLPIISELTLSLYVSIYYESLRRKYHPKSSFNDHQNTFFWPCPNVFSSDNEVCQYCLPVQGMWQSASANTVHHSKFSSVKSRKKCIRYAWLPRNLVQ